MSLIVRKAGSLDTFQDLGRFGFAEFGVNPNGAMDKIALRTANLLLGNPEGCAALEMHVPSPTLEFGEPVSFAITGGSFGATLDGADIAPWKTIDAKKGSILEFKKRGSKGRCYLQIRHGFDLKTWLGSDSTNLIAKTGGFEGRRLNEGDVVPFKNPELASHSLRAAAFQTIPDSSIARLRFVPGPSFFDLTGSSALKFERGEFRIKPASNRMGYRLSGPPLCTLNDDERISSAVTFGTIQLLPDGQLVILMADHQTTGGYPNLGTVIGPDLSVAAQSVSGQVFEFRRIAVEEAEQALADLEQEFAFLRCGLHLHGLGL